LTKCPFYDKRKAQSFFNARDNLNGQAISRVEEREERVMADNRRKDDVAFEFTDHFGNENWVTHGEWEDMQEQATNSEIYDDDESREDERRERANERMKVLFTVDTRGVRGEPINDYRGRTKRVFPARSWIGPQPKHGEKLEVRVVHDTKPNDPKSGTLFVERRIPVVGTGGQFGRCTKCGEWKVPRLRSAGTIGPNGLVNCRACSELHQLK
jgi:hypothetical protein